MDCLTQGVELNKLIPAIRKKFIELLEKKGLNDSEIAKRLGVTKAAVSQYKNKKRGKNITFPANLKEDIEKSSDRIFKGKSANSEINNLLSRMKKTRFTCCICGVCK